MRLQDCIQDIDQVVTAPLVRDAPEEEWVSARGSGLIPTQLFDLYIRAKYLSFGAAPPFLADADNILFSYFSMVLRSLKESFAEAERLLVDFTEARQLIYDPGKKARREPWEPHADARAQRSFRYFLVSLYGTLDSAADMVALFFAGLVPRLRLGRAQFVRIEKWLHRPLAGSRPVLTPYESRLEDLHRVLRPLVFPDSPEREWLPLMRLFRNKAAHLGDQVFRYVSLHDERARFYTFIPRQWPYIWERHMKPPQPGQPRDPDFFPRLFRETLIHEDVVSYAQGLRRKVSAVVGATVGVIIQAYDEFQGFPLNQAALAELQGSSEAYAFEYFLESRDAAG